MGFRESLVIEIVQSNAKREHCSKRSNTGEDSITTWREALGAVGRPRELLVLHSSTGPICTDGEYFRVSIAIPCSMKRNETHLRALPQVVPRAATRRSQARQNHAACAPSLRAHTRLQRHFERDFFAEDQHEVSGHLHRVSEVVGPRRLGLASGDPLIDETAKLSGEIVDERREMLGVDGEVGRGASVEAMMVM